MSRLSEIVSVAAEAALRDGPFSSREVAKGVLPELSADERETLAVEALSRRIAEAASRGKAALRKAANDTQPDLPMDLPRALHIDTDGNKLKLTLELTQLEVKRAIEIREASIAADKASVGRLKDAYEMAEPIWRKHPNWPLGRALSEAVKNSRRGKAA